MCLVFVYVHVAFSAIEPAKNFWKERKASVTLLAQLPAMEPALLPRVRPQIPSTENSELNAGAILPATHLKLPLAFANLKSANFPAGWKPSDSLVIYIQDVHQNSEAQQNISKSVEELIGQGRIDFVALEGAFEPVNLSRFREFKDQNAVRKTADYLLRENKISGPIHAALSGTHETKIIGIDDPALYNGHVSAYRESVGKVPEIKQSIARQEQELEQKKQSVFSPPLLEFDSSVQAYRKGTLPLGDYVKQLKGKTEMTTLFLRALEMEKALNFAQVEAERSSVIQSLLKNLTKQDTERLVSASLQYRSGKVRHTDFYGYLKTLCEKNGVRLSDFPSMTAYLRYVLLSDQIKPEQFLADIHKLEASTYQSLARSKPETDLIAQSRRLHLTQKLIDFSLTPDEWVEYQETAVHLEIFSRGGGPAILASFESFFEHAEQRDQAISKNFLRQIKENKSKISLLVTGGYHTEGVSKILAKQNVAVITLSPKITHIENRSGTEYLSVFTQEKTPLEKLFDGDKLFVAQNPFADRVRLLGASLIAAIFDPAGGALTRESAFQFLSHPLGAQFKLTAEQIGNSFRMTLKGVGGKEIVSTVTLADDKIKEVASLQPSLYIKAKMILFALPSKIGALRASPDNSANRTFHLTRPTVLAELDRWAQSGNRVQKWLAQEKHRWLGIPVIEDLGLPTKEDGPWLSLIMGRLPAVLSVGIFIVYEHTLVFTDGLYLSMRWLIIASMLVTIFGQVLSVKRHDNSRIPFLQVLARSFGMIMLTAMTVLGTRFPADNLWPGTAVGLRLYAQLVGGGVLGIVLSIAMHIYWNIQALPDYRLTRGDRNDLQMSSHADGSGGNFDNHSGFEPDRNPTLFQKAKVMPLTALYTIEEGSADENNLALAYSYLKLGRPSEGQRFGDELADRIAGDLKTSVEFNPAEWVIVSPGGTRIPGACSVLAEKVAQTLNLPHEGLNADFPEGRIGPDYSLWPTKEGRYKLLRGMFLDNPSLVSGKRVIFVDDSVMSGTMLEKSIEALKQEGAIEICPYVLARLVHRSDNSYESRVNHRALDHDGVSALAQTLNDPRARYSSWLITYSFDLPEGDFRNLLAALSPAAKLNFYVYAIACFGFEAPWNVNFDLLSEELKNEFEIKFPDSADLNQSQVEKLWQECLAKMITDTRLKIPIESAGDISQTLWKFVHKSPAAPVILGGEMTSRKTYETFSFLPKWIVRCFIAGAWEMGTLLHIMVYFSIGNYERAEALWNAFMDEHEWNPDSVKAQSQRKYREMAFAYLYFAAHLSIIIGIVLGLLGSQTGLVPHSFLWWFHFSSNFYLNIAIVVPLTLVLLQYIVHSLFNIFGGESALTSGSGGNFDNHSGFEPDSNPKGPKNSKEVFVIYVKTLTVAGIGWVLTKMFIVTYLVINFILSFFILDVLVKIALTLASARGAHEFINLPKVSVDFGRVPFIGGDSSNQEPSMPFILLQTLATFKASQMPCLPLMIAIIASADLVNINRIFTLLLVMGIYRYALLKVLFSPVVSKIKDPQNLLRVYEGELPSLLETDPRDLKVRAIGHRFWFDFINWEVKHDAVLWLKEPYVLRWIGLISPFGQLIVPVKGNWKSFAAVLKETFAPQPRLVPIRDEHHQMRDEVASDPLLGTNNPSAYRYTPAGQRPEAKPQLPLDKRVSIISYTARARWKAILKKFVESISSVRGDNLEYSRSLMMENMGKRLAHLAETEDKRELLELLEKELSRERSYPSVRTYLESPDGRKLLSDLRNQVQNPGPALPIAQTVLGVALTAAYAGTVLQNPILYWLAGLSAAYGIYLAAPLMAFGTSKTVFYEIPNLEYHLMDIAGRQMGFIEVPPVPPEGTSVLRKHQLKGIVIASDGWPRLLYQDSWRDRLRNIGGKAIFYSKYCLIDLSGESMPSRLFSTPYTGALNGPEFGKAYERAKETHLKDYCVSQRMTVFSPADLAERVKDHPEFHALQEKARRQIAVRMANPITTGDLLTFGAFTQAVIGEMKLVQIADSYRLKYQGSGQFRKTAKKLSPQTFIAIDLIKNGKTAEAETRLKLNLQIFTDPSLDRLNCLSMLAGIYVETRKREEALQLLDAALRDISILRTLPNREPHFINDLDELEAHLLVQKARIYRSINLPESVEIARSAYEKFPQFYIVRYALALSLAYAGEKVPNPALIEEAIQISKAAMSEFAGVYFTHMVHANVLSIAGKTEESREVLENAARTLPKHSEEIRSIARKLLGVSMTEDPFMRRRAPGFMVRHRDRDTHPPFDAIRPRHATGEIQPNPGRKTNPAQKAAQAVDNALTSLRHTAALKDTFEFMHVPHGFNTRLAKGMGLPRYVLTSLFDQMYVLAEIHLENMISSLSSIIENQEFKKFNTHARMVRTLMLSFQEGLAKFDEAVKSAEAFADSLTTPDEELNQLIKRTQNEVGLNRRIAALENLKKALNMKMGQEPMPLRGVLNLPAEQSMFDDPAVATAFRLMGEANEFFLAQIPYIDGNPLLQKTIARVHHDPQTDKVSAILQAISGDLSLDYSFRLAAKDALKKLESRSSIDTKLIVLVPIFIGLALWNSLAGTLFIAAVFASAFAQNNDMRYLQFFDRAIQFYPANMDELPSVAQKDLQNAITIYKQMRHQPMSLQNRNEWKNIAETFERLAEENKHADPIWVGSMNAMSAFCFFNAGLIVKALTLFDKADERIPQDDPRFINFNMLILKGRSSALFTRLNHRAAIEVQRKALPMLLSGAFPMDLLLMFYQEHIGSLVETGEYQEAIEAYNKMDALNPKDKGLKRYLMNLITGTISEARRREKLRHQPDQAPAAPHPSGLSRNERDRIKQEESRLAKKSKKKEEKESHKKEIRQRELSKSAIKLARAALDSGEIDAAEIHLLDADSSEAAEAIKKDIQAARDKIAREEARKGKVIVSLKDFNRKVARDAGEEIVLRMEPSADGTVSGHDVVIAVREMLAKHPSDDVKPFFAREYTGLGLRVNGKIKTFWNRGLDERFVPAGQKVSLVQVRREGNATKVHLPGIVMVASIFFARGEIVSAAVTLLVLMAANFYSGAKKARLPTSTPIENLGLPGEDVHELNSYGIFTADHLAWLGRNDILNLRMDDAKVKAVLAACGLDLRNTDLSYCYKIGILQIPLKDKILLIKTDVRTPEEFRKILDNSPGELLRRMRTFADAYETDRDLQERLINSAKALVRHESKTPSPSAVLSAQLDQARTLRAAFARTGDDSEQNRSSDRKNGALIRKNAKTLRGKALQIWSEATSLEHARRLTRDKNIHRSIVQWFLKVPDEIQNIIRFMDSQSTSLPSINGARENLSQAISLAARAQKSRSPDEARFALSRIADALEPILNRLDKTLKILALIGVWLSTSAFTSVSGASVSPWLPLIPVLSAIVAAAAFSVMFGWVSKRVSPARMPSHEQPESKIRSALDGMPLNMNIQSLAGVAAGENMDEKSFLGVVVPLNEDPAEYEKKIEQQLEGAPNGLLKVFFTAQSTQGLYDPKTGVLNLDVLKAELSKINGIKSYSSRRLILSESDIRNLPEFDPNMFDDLEIRIILISRAMQALPSMSMTEILQNSKRIAEAFEQSQ